MAKRTSICSARGVHGVTFQIDAGTDYSMAASRLNRGHRLTIWGRLTGSRTRYNATHDDLRSGRLSRHLAPQARLRRPTGARPQTLPARPPRYGQLRHASQPAGASRRWPRRRAERLYTHQAEAINAALAGQNVVVATSTASGKTLCFNVPVLEALARDPLARALYLYPTKALAQDQLGKWQALGQGRRGTGSSTRWPRPTTATRPRRAQPRSARQPRVLLTNPDMLHAGILPNHPLWAEFFRHLNYVVIDEAHTYRGVFGSQVACVLRRLRRVCALYQGQGSGPGSGDRRQPASTSASIASFRRSSSSPPRPPSPTRPSTSSC